MSILGCRGVACLTLALTLQFSLAPGIESALAGTTVPGGAVSGTWTLSGSPYLITGNINVPSGATLNVEPGVTIEFQGYYSLTVYGYLQAIGTEADSIRFTASSDWNGLTFQDAPDSSHVEYCSLSARATTFALVYCVHSNPVISHSTISGNSSFLLGSGIYLYGSSPEISHCTISGNQGDTGSGIFCESGSFPVISSCTITGNVANHGGGIGVENGARPMISGCTITGNRAGNGGGVAFLEGGGGTIANSILADNSAANKGGGIYVSSPGNTCSLTNSTLTGNDSNYSGGGVHIQSAAGVSIDRSIIEGNACVADRGGAIYAVACGDLAIDHSDILKNRAFSSTCGVHLNGPTNLAVSNCIFQDQQGIDIAFEAYLSATVTYSDFYGEGGWGPFGGGPAGLGDIVQINANGDSCDVFYNIFLDPLLVDPAGGDYHLTEDSPCIDAGNPASPLDPDGTVADMGVFPFDQGTAVPGIVGPGTSVPALSAASPNPFRERTEIRYTLPTAVPARVAVFDIRGRRVATLRDGMSQAGTYPVIWNGREATGVAVAPGVYFVRLEAGGITATRAVVLVR